VTRRDETPAVDRARDLLAQAAAADPSAQPAVDVARAALDGLAAQCDEWLAARDPLAPSDWPEPSVTAEHFHGCPEAAAGLMPFDCDWCQDRARGMAE
jgi:hypothetical protein